MIPIQAYLVSAHLDDLRREAAAARRAREAALAAGDTFGGASRPPRRPDVRRGLALAAVRLSRVAAQIAERLDPAFDEALARREAFRRDRLDVWAPGR